MTVASRRPDLAFAALRASVGVGLCGGEGASNLSGLLVRRGVVGDLEEMQVDHLFHLVVVSPPLAHDDGGVEQEDVSAVQRESGHCGSIDLFGGLTGRLGPPVGSTGSYWTLPEIWRLASARKRALMTLGAGPLQRSP